jgi:hypothetical protein
MRQAHCELVNFDTVPTVIRQNTTLQYLCLEDTQDFEQEAYKLCGEAQTIGIAFRRDRNIFEDRWSIN